jgi:anti-anti-sigma factor
MATVYKPFSTELRQRHGVAVASLSGDLSNVYKNDFQSFLRELVEDPQRQAAILDMSRVTYLASFAVAAVGYYFKVMNDRGGFLALVLPSEQLLKPFRLAGLTEVVPVFSSLEEAIEAFKAQRTRSDES